MLLSFGLALFFMVVSFGSCSSTPTNTNTSASTVNTADEDEETSRRRSDSDEDEPEDCDDDEGDPCKDDDDCEATCAHIYSGKTSSITSCKNRGDETVGRLEEIHDILMGYKAGATGAEVRSDSKVKSELAKIRDDDEDVDHDALKCYLQIGSHKYIREIKNGLSGGDDIKKRANLIETLKWLVEDDKESAEAIADLNNGDNILEALLMGLAGEITGIKEPTDKSTKDCIGGAEYDFGASDVPPNSIGYSNNLNKAIWDFDSGSEEIRVLYEDSGKQIGVIDIDSDKNAKLYNALSCFQGGSIGSYNVFSYSAEENNEHIFDLAFELLRGICDDVKAKSAGQDKACARALMCWTSWQDSCGSSGRGATGTCSPSTSEDNDLWKRAREHESYLEKDSGSEYNECRAKDFADFF